MTTLAVDIGGGTVKVLALDDQGAPVTETLSRPTPAPA
ncbi:MAG: ROK family protein, partial [Deltaproteobacteria bacterium]|nr:ROK family protein [Deltaproteobacteria bacterium]